MKRHFVPREYQKQIVDHICDLPRNAVFAGMGLGKTVSTLTALDGLYLSGVEQLPTLVLAPKRVALTTWPEEVKKWDHLSQLSVEPIIGTPEERRKALRKVGGSTNIFSINYDNIPWLMEELNGDFPFGTVVADESTRLKGFRTQQGTRRAQYLGAIAHGNATRWINLTGTPAPNGLQDLWGQSWFIDAGVRLGRSYDAFTNRWFRPTRDGYGVEPKEHSQVEIQDRLRDVCLSLNAKDYFDLDEPIRNYIYVDLPPKARELYQTMEKEFFAEIEGRSIEAFNSAARSQKLLQLASGAVYVEPDVYDDTQPRAKEWRAVHDVKLDALESVIQEAAGMPVLVAYHFRSELARLRDSFSRARVLDDKPSTIKEWNAGKIPQLLTHAKSAGHGLNLQDGSNIICHTSHWWDSELLQQINERIGPVRQHQSGYKRPVFEHYIIARDTLEEQVIERRQTKCSVEESFRQAMKRRKR